MPANFNIDPAGTYLSFEILTMTAEFRMEGFETF
jgi:hypothetical protein